MLTIDALKEFGADTDTGLQRCVNRESLYLRLVKMVPTNEGFERLSKAINENNFVEAFQAAHGLKGIVNNLSLTPLAEPISEITEYLRAEKQMDYAPYVKKILEEREKLAKLCEE